MRDALPGRCFLRQHDDLAEVSRFRPPRDSSTPPAGCARNDGLVWTPRLYPPLRLPSPTLGGGAGGGGRSLAHMFVFGLKTLLTFVLPWYTKRGTEKPERYPAFLPAAARGAPIGNRTAFHASSNRAGFGVGFVGEFLDYRSLQRTRRSRSLMGKHAWRSSAFSATTAFGSRP